MLLTFAVPGREYRVVSLMGGRGFNRKLFEMGIKPGSTIRVIINSGKGPILIGVNNLRFALGKGMASKIIVNPIY